jgi:hypothetical protein
MPAIDSLRDQLNRNLDDGDEAIDEGSSNPPASAGASNHHGAGYYRDVNHASNSFAALSMSPPLSSPQGSPLNSPIGEAPLDDIQRSVSPGQAIEPDFSLDDSELPVPVATGAGHWHESQSHPLLNGLHHSVQLLVNNICIIFNF